MNSIVSEFVLEMDFIAQKWNQLGDCVVNFCHLNDWFLENILKAYWKNPHPFESSQPCPFPNFRFPSQNRVAAATSQPLGSKDSSSSWETLRLSTSTSLSRTYQRTKERDPSWRFDADDEESPPAVRRKLIDSFDEIVLKAASFAAQPAGKEDP